MKVKEAGKIMGRKKPQSGTGKGAVALVESSKPRAKLPAKPVKKVAYKK